MRALVLAVTIGLACAQAVTPSPEPPPDATPASSEAAPTAEATVIPPSTVAAPPVTATTPASSDEAPIGVGRCDEYLALYRSCEPQLRAEIAAGDRRPFSGERGRLRHLASTPERAGLADACEAMLTELLPRCGVTSPTRP